MQSVLFILATHGNENFSVPVFEELEREFSKQTYNYDWLIANERAYAANQRFIDVDMNRSAPGNALSTSYEEARVAEVIEHARKYDIVVDIHGALSDCGITTLIPLPTADNIALAQSLNVARNVIWYSTRSAHKGPIAQHVGRPAIELECGPKNDPKTARDLRDVVERFLTTRAAPSPTHFDGDIYEVYGKLTDPTTTPLEDFVQTTQNGESFYPYLSNNTYPNITCYKMKTVDATRLISASVDSFAY